MTHKASMSGSTGTRNHISERRRGTTGWLYTHSLLFAMVLVALLSALSGCGPEQTNVGQATGNSVPVSLSISMPQESAAASTSGSRFWATLQSWLPSIPSAWAQTTPPLTPLSAIQVDVTGPDLASISTTKDIPPGTLSGSPFTIDLDVPVGPDRVFTVSGFVGTGNLRFQGKSRPTTLTSGQAASVEVILTPNTGTVTGMVTSGAPGQPLPGDVSVAVTGTSLTTTTNSDVRYQFTLTGIPQGSQTLTVSAVGFASTTKTVTVVAVSTVDAGTIALTPLPPIIETVTGTVTNAGTGARLSDATVTVAGTSLRTTTNSDGNFRLDGVPEGLQALAVSKSGFTAATRAVTVVAGSPVSAGTIALTPLPPTTGTVTGTVTNEGTGSGFLDATVAVNGTGLSVTTDNNGNFTLKDVPQGPQTLRISASGYAPKTKAVTVMAGSSVSAGTIALNPAELVFIRVTSYDPKPNLCLHTNFKTYPLIPSFNPEQSTYTVEVPFRTSFCIVMTKTDLKQTVTLNNKPVSPVPNDNPLVLYPIVSVTSSGDLFTIVVTAPDGVTKRTYTIDPF